MFTLNKNLLVEFLICTIFCVLKCSTQLNENYTLALTRLPTSILPTKYNLHINTRIHQENRTYSGNVTINLLVNKTTDQIVLHSKSLRNIEVHLLDHRHRYRNLRYSHDNRTDFLRIFSPLTLTKGKTFRLEIHFVGYIGEETAGFYRDYYQNDNNKTIMIARTHFEAIEARLAFPCFDEITFKSRFQISITHGRNFSAISTMPVECEPTPSSEKGMITTKFQETPPISTYLVAFVVSDFRHISEYNNGILHRMFYPPNSKDNGIRNQKNAIATVNTIEKYFGFKYPLPKLDLIRLERNLGDGMENWGLVTFSSQYTLPDRLGPNINETMYMIMLHNHEIVHQWFGNLVTTKWWSYVWLKECFAWYYSFVIADLVYPDYRFMEYFLIDANAVINIGINNAMTYNVERVEDFEFAFGITAYHFAARILRMLQNSIGDRTYIKGVSYYLNKFKYSVADEDDFYTALQAAIDEDRLPLFQNLKISTVMHTWSHNIGFPNITVIRNYHQRTIKILQSSDPLKRWWIPLTFATASMPNFEKLTADYILPPQPETTINLRDININLSNNDWLIVNKQQSGMFNVMYDNRNLELIAEALNRDHKQIHMFNREQLFRELNEAMNKGNFDSIKQTLEILRYLENEEEVFPWNSAVDLISKININLAGSKAFEIFKNFTRTIIRNVFRKVYMRPVSELTVTEILTRSKIIDIACRAGLYECKQESASNNETQRSENIVYKSKLEREVSEWLQNYKRE